MRHAFLISILLLITVGAAQHPPVKEKPMIEDGKKVKMHYILKVDGQVLEDTAEKGPVEFEYGNAQMIPAFEAQIQGLKPGDEKSFSLTSEESYGPVNPEAVVPVERQQLGVENVTVGMVFTATGQNGAPMRGIVKEVQGEKILLDFNHPLAGKELHFEVKVVEVV